MSHTPWFPQFGVPASLPGGSAGTGWLANLQNGLASLVQSFLVGRLATSLAAFLALRAILEGAQGRNPLPSVFGAMFLLALQSTLNLIQSYNSGTPYATTDVLDSLWN